MKPVGVRYNGISKQTDQREAIVEEVGYTHTRNLLDQLIPLLLKKRPLRPIPIPIPLPILLCRVCRRVVSWGMGTRRRRHADLVAADKGGCGCGH